MGALNFHHLRGSKSLSMSATRAVYADSSSLSWSLLFASRNWSRIRLLPLRAHKHAQLIAHACARVTVLVLLVPPLLLAMLPFQYRLENVAVSIDVPNTSVYSIPK